ncbi:hypothetical protein XF_1541 [Xylella fastidiosa 9a5c]|uniref:Uncharacterized protein n=1 Tax=Xylella fastidiosa (strain 9a5c) TaxID=160492 RepID=Q9PD38_XYLFA|nr:hypothetical protein XF_1541 [Xylella fastidiosa 9a5c]
MNFVEEIKNHAFAKYSAPFWQCYLYLYLVFLIPLCFNLIAAINVLQYIHVMLDSSII